MQYLAYVLSRFVKYSCKSTAVCFLDCAAALASWQFAGSTGWYHKTYQHRNIKSYFGNLNCLVKLFMILWVGSAFSMSEKTGRLLLHDAKKITLLILALGVPISTYTILLHLYCCKTQSVSIWLFYWNWLLLLDQLLYYKRLVEVNQLMNSFFMSISFVAEHCRS